MTDRPIIFSGAMVRALLEGRKTMTRRLLRQPEQTKTGHWHIRGIGGGCVLVGNASEEEIGDALLDYAPYAVGDRLYVRESYANCRGMGFDFPFYYMADIRKGSDSDDLRKQYGVKWKPSIHMPRTVSRITLEVTSVKVERLQDISEEDAIAEGVKAGAAPYDFDVPGLTHGRYNTPQDAFKALWQSLNAKRAPWDSNPWVGAPSFTVEKINIDAMK